MMKKVDSVRKINNNYRDVLSRIHTAASKSGRDPEDIQLVVVTKGHPIRVVQDTIAAGITTLGENYVDEAIIKINTISNPEVVWHMIGHIQSRKAKLVSQHFSWVHSLDRLKTAKRLNRFAGESGRVLPVLLEFNVSGETTKHGWSAWDKHNWVDLIEEITQIVSLPNILVKGLMTVPPFDLNPDNVRPYFRRLSQLRDFLVDNIQSERTENGIHTFLSELSMGMSSDYEVAIQEGATMVRVGTAILGRRI